MFDDLSNPSRISANEPERFVGGDNQFDILSILSNEPADEIPAELCPASSDHL
ncbi:MAG: hypothetical protein ABSG03_14205 [Bryobacteraceae bacterium]|jgi:hypothetical protein